MECGSYSRLGRRQSGPWKERGGYGACVGQGQVGLREVATRQALSFFPNSDDRDSTLCSDSDNTINRTHRLHQLLKYEQEQANHEEQCLIGTMSDHQHILQQRYDP